MKFCWALLPLLALALGCAQSGDASNSGGAAAVTPVVFEGPTVTFSVPDMSCPDGCAVVVHDTLVATEGVKDCNVDFDNKLAVVSIDPDT
ncbi:MAG: cation transporter, partial [Planctomycetales bacterium]|nr:cation transporter [Planctomycetales bacterium]